VVLSIPNNKILEDIADSFCYQLNKELNPISEFEIYNEELISGIACTISEDYSLFSIDGFNVRCVGLLDSLILILQEYGIETVNLKGHVDECLNKKVEVIINYQKYWVSLLPGETNDSIYIRFRAFVEEQKEIT